MPYTHIPESAMAGGLAKIIGKIQGKLNAQVMAGMADVVNQLQAPVCPDDGTLNQLDNKRNKLNNQLRSSGNALNRFRKIPGTLKPPVSGLKAAIKILLAIPIPQAVPPGIGIPVNITNKFGDILVLLKEIVAQIGELIAAIEAALEVPSSQLAALNGLAGRVDMPLKSCRIQNQLMNAINNEEIEPEILQDSGLVSFVTDSTGALTRTVDPAKSPLSRAGQVFLNNAGRDMNSESRGFSLTPTSQKLLEEGLLPDSARNAANDQQQRELLLNELLEGLNRLQQAELPDSLRDALNDIATSFSVLQEQNANSTGAGGSGNGGGLSNLDPDDPRLTYTSTDGTVYRFSIVPDPNAPAIAPRNFAEARDLGGVLRFTGPKSFSQDLDVLLDEVKFQIDNQENAAFAANVAATT